MYLELYPDIIFILNFSIDFILLFLLKLINKKSSKIRRLIIGAACGALFAVVLSVFPWINIVIRFLIMNIIASAIMILIAFGKMKKTDLLKQIIVLYLITFFVGGLINSVYYHTQFRVKLINFGNSLVLSNISWIYVIIVMLLLIPTTILLLWIRRWYRSNERETYEVELYYNDRSIHTIGLMDSGNCLYDPIFRKPVMVIENSVLEELLPPELLEDLKLAKEYMEDKELSRQWEAGSEHAKRFRFIPYQSIGKTKGMMLGLILDKVLIHTGKETVSNERVTVAICDNLLSAREDYHVILHKKLI